MPLTFKQKEFIDTINDYNNQWKCKQYEINMRPATFLSDRTHDEHLQWSDTEKHMRWNLHRETFLNKDIETTNYTFTTSWLLGKGKCRSGDIIKQTRIEIYDIANNFIKIPHCRLEGQPNYGIPFNNNYLYKDGILYKLIWTKSPQKQLPR
jgi:hypothetical protein